jgi:hypothetical protein
MLRACMALVIPDNSLRGLDSVKLLTRIVTMRQTDHP